MRLTIWIWVVLGLIIINTSLGPLVVARSGGGFSGYVRHVLDAIQVYSNDHNGRLPQSLSELEELYQEHGGTVIRDPVRGVTIADFLYVPPEPMKSVDFPRETFPEDMVILIFPLERGAFVGFLNGEVRFLEGGWFPDTTEISSNNSLQNWLWFSSGAVTLLVISGGVFILRRQKEPLTSR